MFAFLSVRPPLCPPFVSSVFLLFSYSGFPLPCNIIIHLRVYIVKLISYIFAFFCIKKETFSRLIFHIPEVCKRARRAPLRNNLARSLAQRGRRFRSDSLLSDSDSARPVATWQRAVPEIFPPFHGGPGSQGRRRCTFHLCACRVSTFHPPLSQT